MNSLEYYIKYLNLNKLLKIGRINFNDSHIKKKKKKKRYGKNN